MRKTVINILLGIFAVLALISGLMVYYTHQLPIEIKQVDTLYTYGHYGKFNYLAILEPNTIYNKTTLGPEEGSIYRKITEEVNVNFTYTFQGTEPANLTVQWNVTESLKTPQLRIEIAETQHKAIDMTGTSANLYVDNIHPINVSSVQDLVNSIERETGMSLVEYNVTIGTQMHIIANTTHGLIDESFNPELTLRFKSSLSTGDVILIEDGDYERTGKITSANTIDQPWVNTQRSISYTLSLLSFPGLLLTIWAFARSRPTKPLRPEALIEDTIEPFKDIISETAEEPDLKKPPSKPTTTISMKTLEDLVKVADIIAKPIFHTRKPPETHTFYVLDETARYEYIMTESGMIERMTKEPEE